MILSSRPAEGWLREDSMREGVGLELSLTVEREREGQAGPSRQSKVGLCKESAGPPGKQSARIEAHTMAAGQKKWRAREFP